MNLEPGAVVLVPVGGGTFHCAATVIEPATMPEVHDGMVWLDVNTIGSHLPQMYRLAEIIEVDVPSEVVAHGLCSSCWGTGKVERFLPTPGQCALCEGNGRIAGLASLATMDLDCERCNEAFTPQRR